MPRNSGTNLYYILPGTEGVPDTTIESDKYNNYIHDVRDDLNLPRPIVAGGTGASTADGALLSLHAEKAGQKVENFDDHPWMAGSFYSLTNATAPPVALHAFSGIVHITDNDNMVLHAVDLTDTFHAAWTRVRTEGLWGAWIRGSSYVSILSSDTVPTGVPENTLWFESDTGLLYILYNDGDTIQWTIACPQPDISTYAIKVEVEADVAGLEADITALETGKVAKAGDQMLGPLYLYDGLPVQEREAASKQYVDAATAGTASFSEAAYLGLQLNGSFIVSQDRNIGIQNTVPGPVHICDGWRALHAPLSNSTIDFSTRGMNLYTHRPYNTPAALAAGDAFYLYTGIEGFRCSRLVWGTASAQPITISFFSRHHRAGLYCIAIQNAARNRTYVATYTQDGSDVEEFKVVNISPDTLGPSSDWLKDTGVGMYIHFVIAAGANHVATANTWTGGSKFTVSGAVNAYQDTFDRFRVTGVMVNVGIVAPASNLVPYLVRTYDEEFALCQRYFQAVNSNGAAVVASGIVFSATTAIFSYRFPVQMRIPPTVAFIAPSNFVAVASGTSYGATAMNVPIVTAEGAQINLTSSGMTIGHGALLQITSINVPAILISASFV